ncbi:hypothetical protein KIN20_030382 [Parelaphostrongylus tenuis]|uniref:Uncharacterized protein n=1 Tax=Parelaphostrongylus tenuis TaxID=148309 RepID=A0AAD5R438_PARTN|nr:hypothetical protein KIN20_030382 [Parelaphostrongylus tenuis]
MTDVFKLLICHEVLQRLKEATVNDDKSGAYGGRRMIQATPIQFRQLPPCQFGDMQRRVALEQDEIEATSTCRDSIAGVQVRTVEMA